jgi:2,4-dienoyl-CoA reductase-like NADH-dependent reductase (Old Yellow Enzyme family)
MSGNADMIASQRPFIENSGLVERLRHELPPTNAAVATYCGRGAEGYPDFQPFARSSS